jgi:subtilisin family serine protease
VTSARLLPSVCPRVVRETVGLVAVGTATLALLQLHGGSAPPARPVALSVGYASAAALDRALGAHPADVLRRLPALHAAVLAPDGDSRAFASAVGRLPGIRYVEPVIRRERASEPALAAPTAGGPAFEWQFAATRSNAVAAPILRAAAAITIAVVDTGADLTAPDLAAKSPTTWSVVGDTADVDDRNGHGTFVASLAAGSVDNGDGIAGSGGDAGLMIVQANRSGTAFTDVDEAAAIVWAVDHGAQIVNLSIGGPTTSQTERDAVDYAADHGVLLVAAAGNDFERGNPVEYPAALIQPIGSNGRGGRGLVVGASTATGTRAPFSSRASFVSLAAPGVDVVGAVAAAAKGDDYRRLVLPGSRAGLYGTGSGTSYAAPQVAGTAALVWAVNPLLSAQQVAEILKETASGHGSWNRDVGYGIVDAAAAVARAEGMPAPPASVRLAGRRLGESVRLTWAGKGAAAFRLSVAEDSGPARLLFSGGPTATSYAVSPGHTYVFTVDAVDAGGAALARSSPYRVSVAKTLRARRR